MIEQNNMRTIEEIYAAFGRGDIQFLLNKLAEDVDWWHPRPADIPWGGNRAGRASVAQFFAAIGEHLEVEQFRPADLLLEMTRSSFLGPSACARRPQVGSMRWIGCMRGGWARVRF